MEKKVENKSNNNSGLPFAIIGLVLLAAIGVGWWFYSTSKTPTAKTGTTAGNKKPVDDRAALELYSKAPAGAQPANMLGSPNAAVTIEEFADFQCPTCASVHGKMKEINALYGNRIKFVYRNFPLSQIHKNAYDASLAAEAAGFQGKYWDMQNQLFTNQKAWSNSNEARKLFTEYAQKIGLDAARFQNDLISLSTKARVDADIQRGRALNINGTPTVFINGRQIAFEQMDVNPMKQIIDAELQKSGAQQQTGQPAPQPQTSQTQSNQNAAGNATNSAVKK